MDATRSRLLKSVVTAFELVEQRPGEELLTGFGPLGLRLLFLSPELADAYRPSLLPPTHCDWKFSLAVLSSEELDLSTLIPDPPEQGRAFHGDGFAAIWQAPMLYILDKERKLGVIWLSNDAVPAWELSRPASPLVQSMFLDQTWLAVHAASVGHLGQALLLGGPGRSGKSTAALACASAGWDFAGDDIVLANCMTGVIEPVYRSARLRIDMVPFFSSLLDLTRTVTSEADDARHELTLSRDFKIEGGKLAAILLPRREGYDEVKFTAAKASDAFHSMLLSTSFSAPGPLKVISDKLATLLTRAPIFFVDTGCQPRLIPQAFEKFLGALRN